jgi:hypothetical protein
MMEKSLDSFSFEQSVVGTDPVRFNFLQGIGRRINLRGRRGRFIVALVVTGLIAVGCSQRGFELAPVTGTVTMDGEPLPHALVRFLPQEGTVNRPSTGVTNMDGSYRLLYSAREEGAIVGPVNVEITTGDPEQPKLYPETIPSKYNIETTLKRDVASGENIFDFDLESK